MKRLLLFFFIITSFLSAQERNWLPYINEQASIGIAGQRWKDIRGITVHSDTVHTEALGINRSDLGEYSFYNIGKMYQDGTSTFTGVMSLNNNLIHTGNYRFYNNYISGWTGSGWELSYGIEEENKSRLELDNLVVRGRLSVYELLVRQIRATNGAVFVTSAAKADSVWVTDSIHVRFADPTEHNLCPFTENDLIIVQKFQPPNGNPGPTDLIKKVEAIVTSVNGRSITVEYNSGSSTFAAGDEVVRIGNTTDATRQASIYLTADDSYNPYIDMVTGVNSWSAWGLPAKTKVRMGNLGGITDADLGGALSGYGFYGQNVYLKGTFNLNSSSNIDSVYAFKSIVADVDTLKDTVATHTTSILQNAAQILLKASLITADSLGNRISTAESDIIINAWGTTIRRTINGTTDSTMIIGDIIKTGQIESNNWDANLGSQYDLDAGTIKLGGSSDPNFIVDSLGNATMKDAKFEGRITSDLIPDVTDAYNLGDAALMWRKAWIGEIEATVMAKNTLSLVGGWLRVAKGAGNLGSRGGVNLLLIQGGTDYTVNDVITVIGGDTTCQATITTVVFGTPNCVAAPSVKGFGYTLNTQYNVTGGTGTGAHAYPWIMCDTTLSTDNVVNFGQEMTLNDVIEFRNNNKVEYMRIGALYNGHAGFYNVTRNIDGGTADNWEAVTAYSTIGKYGDGFIDLAANDLPRISVFSQLDSVYNNRTEIIRIGDIYGMPTISAHKYGIYIGDENQFLSYSNGILSIRGTINLLNSISYTSVSGLGALATESSVAYGDVTGTKPPANADVTLSAINGGLAITGGGLELLSGGAAIRGGKTSFTDDAHSGFWLGDVSGTTKFIIGKDANIKMTYDGANLTLIGGQLNAASINGGTITGGSMNAGTFRTNTVGKRIVIDSAMNSMYVYDEDNAMVGRLHGAEGNFYIDSYYNYFLLITGGGGGALTFDQDDALIQTNCMFRVGDDLDVTGNITGDGLGITLGTPGLIDLNGIAVASVVNTYTQIRYGQSGLMSRATGSDSYWLGNAYFNSSGHFCYAGSEPAQRIYMTGGNIYLEVAGSGTKDNIITFTNAATLNTDGIKALPTYSKTVGATNRAMYVDNTGQYGYVASDSTLKQNIQPLEIDVNLLYQLNPVSFNYKKNPLLKDRTFGLIAQEVNKIIPQLTNTNSEGEANYVAYEKLPTLLLAGLIQQHNILEEHKNLI